jgi:hypothetical protein
MITVQELIEEHRRLCSECYQTWYNSSPFSHIDDEYLYISIGKILQSEFFLRKSGVDGVSLTEDFFKEKYELACGCYDEIKKHRP